MPTATTTALCEWEPVRKSSGLKPVGRHGHRAVAIGKLMIVFGGGNAGILNELHVYDSSLNEWFNPVVSGDIPPGCAAFGFATVESQIVLFGGMLEYGIFSNHLYILNPVDWSWKNMALHRNDLEPLPRIGHTFTSIGNKIYLFGGLHNDRCASPTDGAWIFLNDFHTLQIDNYQRHKWSIVDAVGTCPEPRESHTAVAYNCSKTNSSTLVIYGGMNRFSKRLGDTWLFDVQTLTWIRPDVSGIEPLPRSLHSAAIVDNLMFIFGGWVPLQPHSNEMWLCSNTEACLNLDTMAWQQVVSTKRPNPRTGHCTVQMDGRRIYIWSGRDGYKKSKDQQVCLNDMWFLEVDVPSPPSRPEMLRWLSNTMELKWNKTPTAQYYLLECQVETARKPVHAQPIVQQKRLKFGTLVQLSQSTNDGTKMAAINVSDITGSMNLNSSQAIPQTSSILHRSENVTLTMMPTNPINPDRTIAGQLVRLAQGKAGSEGGAQLTILKPMRCDGVSSALANGSRLINVGVVPQNMPASTSKISGVSAQTLLHLATKLKIKSDTQSQQHPTIAKNLTSHNSGLPANAPTILRRMSVAQINNKDGLLSKNIINSMANASSRIRRISIAGSDIAPVS